MECWDEEALLSIGRGVGYPMKVDDTSINKQYGYYANILVDVDLTKPIPDQILVSTEDYEFWQDVVVTKIPKFCNHCKIVGHSVTECRKLKGVLDKGKDPIVDNTPKDQTEKATKNTKRNKGKKVADHTTKEWMEKKNNEQDSFAAEISKSNSFQVLQEEEEAYEEPQQQLAVVTVEPVMGEVEPLAIAVEKTQNDTIQGLPPDPDKASKPMNETLTHKLIDEVAEAALKLATFNGGTSTKVVAQSAKKIPVDAPLTRGIRKKKAKNRLFKIIRNHDPDYLGLLEPMIYPKDVPYGLLQSLGFSSIFLHNERGNKKPNIWLLWKNGCVVPQLLSYTEQCLSVDVNGVMLTFVHGHTYYVKRRELWSQFSPVSKPWLVLGDFNSYLSIDEKRGVRKPIVAGMEDFRSFLNDNLLLEVPNKGIKYTWCNQRHGSRRVLGKIDRMCCNEEWLLQFPGWSYKILSRLCSDHAPLIGWTVVVPKPANCPFKFLNIYVGCAPLFSGYGC
ncbi:Ribonuclease h domain [Thalictrum thalictroides]|uniref:Ribonuclease h domain n=1 Tax=Thalictrum thalictroides TaxID=46969 RepID=A0A7J6W9Y1_THATH|nr:Ribonuclease h domain [Thalictrum thalictroides]